jgi:aconitate hydratase
MFACGAGGLDVAVAMGGGAFYLIAPNVIGVRLVGKLRPWVSAKDVILHLLSMRGTKGNVNCVVEYFGEGVKTLSVPDRATITNMGAEMGVTTSIFPSDELTKAFLKAQGREKVWQELKADEGAVYDETIEIDLSKVVPMLAAPHSPGNIVTVASHAGKKVDQVAVGSCTNSSLRDLTVTAEILKGKNVAAGTSLIVAPGSKQVFSMIAANGMLKAMVDAGARIMESTCGFCIGNGQAPCTDAVSVRTSNRNFEGRSGTQSAQVFLASPETAALAAVNGCFVDPLSMPASAYPSFVMPDAFSIDDRMVLAPAADASSVAIVRGPNIGEPPANTPLKDSLNGPALAVVGDKITTDHIMPAGSRLKYRSNIKKYAEFVFEHTEPTFAKTAAAAREAGKDVFIVAGESYGQGSSREHAAMCPMFLGVKAVIAKGFERIHVANLVNFGIIPLVFRNAADYEAIAKGDILAIEGVIAALESGADVTVRNATKGTSFACTYALSKRQVAMLKVGGLLNYTKRNAK